MTHGWALGCGSGGNTRNPLTSGSPAEDRREGPTRWSAPPPTTREPWTGCQATRSPPARGQPRGAWTASRRNREWGRRRRLDPGGTRKPQPRLSSSTASFVAGFGKEGRITNRADRISSADDEDVPVKSSPVNGDDPLEDEPAPPVTLAAVRRRTRAGGVGSARTSATGSPPRSARRFESVLRCEPARIASDPPSVHVAIGAPLDTADTSSPAASVTLGGPPGPAAATPSAPARSTTLETLARTGSTNTIERASFPTQRRSSHSSRSRGRRFSSRR